MKQLQRLSTAVVLTTVLAISVFAGDIPIDKSAPPPPPSTSIAKTSEEIDASDSTRASAAANDSLTLIGLSVLQSMLSLF